MMLIVNQDHDNDGDLDIIDSHGGSFDADGRFGMLIFENGIV